MMYFEVIQTIAEVAGALIGFVGVVFVLGQRAVRSLTVSERSGLTHLLVGSVGALLISIMIMILLAAIDDQATAWRVSAGIVSLYAFAGSTRAFLDEFRGEHTLPFPINWILPVIAHCLGWFGFLAATRLISGYAPLASVLTLLMGLTVAIAYFISLLTGQYESVKDDA